MKPFLASLLLCCAVFAAPPVPKIVGPTERNPGALTVLDASGSTAERWAWLVDVSLVQVPKDAAPDVSSTVAQLRAMGFEVQEPTDDSEPLWAVSDDGKRLWLSSYPGVYSVVLGVSNADGVVLSPWKVSVKGSLPPPIIIPPPVVIPPPVIVPTDFASKLTAAVKAKPEAGAELGRVANVYVTVADQIKSASVLADTTEKVKALTSGLAKAASPAVWPAIEATVVTPHLATLALAKAADYEPVWRQIAAAIKAGLTDIPPPVVVPPIPVTSLHVLIVEEMDDRHTLPASQVNIFSSTSLRKWFTENNVQWRMFDDDVDQGHLDEKWKAALARPRASVPWVCASNGTKGYEGPLPKTEADLIQLLEKYK